ncbi:MAG: 50S ribosomal protein L25 [Dehalococcoidia bacterium]|nr:50S ribosomal protein L25 [Dehalococcoidia bacterium]
MEQLELRASKRQLLGKKVRSLRRAGMVPAHLFGRGIQSEPLQVDESSLQRVLARVGTSHLVSLMVEGESEPRNVLVKEVQRDYLGDRVIHVDFYQVRMTDKLRVEVPLSMVGEAPAVKSKLGVLMQAMRYLPVECLPADIPESIQVDVSGLAKLEDGIYAKDLKLKDGITILADPDDLIVKVSPIKVTKEEVKPAAVAAEAGAVPSEGGKVAESAKAEAGSAMAGAKSEKPEKGQKTA